MVTANVADLGDEFDEIIADKDGASIAVLGLAGAGGGFIAQEIVNRLAPSIGLSPSPGTPRESVGVGLIKMVVGVALGFGGLKVGGSVGTLAALAGLGTLVIGGGDWINALMSAGGSATGSAPRASATTKVRANQPTATPVNNDEEVRFRASTDGSGSGGSAQASATGTETFR